MSDEEERGECQALRILPEAILCLDHFHMVHSCVDVSVFFGQLDAKADIYIVSGKAREPIRKFVEAHLGEAGSVRTDNPDVRELERLYNLKKPRAAKGPGGSGRKRANRPPQPAERSNG